jgi:hypothetical protein
MRPRHLFGYCLLNDWSAKDIQWWEQVLGPFLGKSFMTSISPWVVTAEAMAPFQAPAAPRAEADPPLMSHLYSAQDQAAGALDVTMESWLRTAAMRERAEPGVRLSRANPRQLYWTFAQMLTHHASNGCNLRPATSSAAARCQASSRNRCHASPKSPRPGASLSRFLHTSRGAGWRMATKSCCAHAPSAKASCRSASANAAGWFCRRDLGRTSRANPAPWI